MSTGRLFSAIFNRVSVYGAAVVTAGAGIYVAKREYNDYQYRQQQDVWHKKMIVVKNSLKQFSDLQNAVNQLVKPADLVNFWKHLYFNQHLDLLTSPEDYAALIITINEFIENNYSPEDTKWCSHQEEKVVDERNRELYDACCNAHQFVVDDITANFERRMKRDGAVPGMTLEAFNRLLEALVMADKSQIRQNNYARLAREWLPYSDMQATVVRSLLKNNIADRFCDKALMQHILKCDTISLEAKQVMLDNEAVRGKYLDTIASHQDLSLVLSSADHSTKRHIMKAIETNESRTIVNAVNQSLRTMDDLLSLLGACRYTCVITNKVMDCDSGLMQRRVLAALSGNKLVDELRQNFASHQDVLGLQAVLFLQGKAPVSLCVSLGKFKAAQAQEVVAPNNQASKRM